MAVGISNSYLLLLQLSKSNTNISLKLQILAKVNVGCKECLHWFYWMYFLKKKRKNQRNGWHVPHHVNKTPKIVIKCAMWVKLTMSPNLHEWEPDSYCHTTFTSIWIQLSTSFITLNKHANLTDKIPFTHISNVLLKPTGAWSQYDVVKCSVLNAVRYKHVQHERKYSSNQKTSSTTTDSKYRLN